MKELDKLNIPCLLGEFRGLVIKAFSAIEKRLNAMEDDLENEEKGRDEIETLLLNQVEGLKDNNAELQRRIDTVNQYVDVLLTYGKRLGALEQSTGEWNAENVTLAEEVGHLGNEINELWRKMHKRAQGIAALNERLDNHGKRISHLEAPSPMLMDAQERLHALDGKGNGEIDPPAGPSITETTGNRLDALEKKAFDIGTHVHDEKGICCWIPPTPKPPTCCEGCLDFPCSHTTGVPDCESCKQMSKEGVKRSCYRKRTCGECKRFIDANGNLLGIAGICEKNGRVECVIYDKKAEACRNGFSPLESK
jgi:hypothetical protein